MGEAMRLFASQGYRATTIAHIQTACGLAPGSGALYKHFVSKRALLEAGVQQYVDAMVTTRESFFDALPDDPVVALRIMQATVWATMEHDRDMLRVMLRDLDDFPDLLDRLWQAVRTNVYGGVATWLGGLPRAQRARTSDIDATAGVMAASLTYYPILSALIGHAPGDIAADDYAAAWLAQAMATLGLC